ncbi:MAG: methyltransferase domain-containing protein [Halieaceae bacterium]|jgi:SAM-dependent methyltransferase|nr:methyltransferase domain-containing protein [Halieaceae bacterium]
MQLFKPLEVAFRRWRDRALAQRLHGGDAVHCPVCEQDFAHFLPAGTGERARPNAVCPGCRSRERDRLSWLFLRDRQDALFFRHMQFLHVAPEPRLSQFFYERIGEGYITADLMRRDVMVTLDVQDMVYPNETMDAIYCSHVLQDVPDDRRAIAECFRVLRPGGWAVLNVPLFAAKTEEAATPGNVRAAWDKRPDEHVRSYGHDYADRLCEAGFGVEVVTPTDLVPDADERQRLGVDGPRTGFVHFVTRA